MFLYCKECHVLVVNMEENTARQTAVAQFIRLIKKWGYLTHHSKIFDRDFLIGFGGFLKP